MSKTNKRKAPCRLREAVTKPSLIAATDEFALSAQEKRLIRVFRQCHDEIQDHLIGTAEYCALDPELARTPTTRPALQLIVGGK